MFTIKHIDPEGNEFAIEAESYFVEWDREQDLVRVTTYDAKFRDGCNYTGMWAGVPARGTSSCAGLSHHQIFVMNRFGATISTVFFTDFRQGHFGVATKDDPIAEKLAA